MLNNKKFKRLKSGLKNLKGVNIYGHKVCRWKGGSSSKHSIVAVDFFRNFLHNKALVINIIKTYKRSCLVALIKYSSGSYSYVLAPDGLQPGFYVKTLIKPLNCSLGYKLGFSVLLKYLLPHTFVYNVEIKELCGGKYVRSGGSLSEFLSIDAFNQTALIQLPTGLRIWVSYYCLVNVGRPSNSSNLLGALGKAGLNRNYNLRPVVRGVAMNPVDHPHGGRTKTNSPELTPWNKIAKKNR
jgi:large subunit ribosomal protein L2